jgi:hypothetical protein
MRSKNLHLVFVGDLPEKDYLSTSYDLKDGSVIVYGCGSLLGSGFCMESYPVFVLMDIRDTVDTHATYRILWLELDHDRGYMVMGIRMVGWRSIEELRRLVRINQVIGDLPSPHET